MTLPDLFIATGVAILGLVLAYVWRVATGPTAFDRILGVVGFGTKTTLVLLLLGVGFERVEMLVDLSLAYALLGFAGVLAAARYFERTERR